MREILKLTHIYTDAPSNFKLRDFNLTVGSGEVIYLVANTDVEKYLIKDIITGMNADYRGGIYYRNRKQTRWNSQEAYVNGIFYVDERHQLVPKFTIMENICVMKKTAPAEVIIPLGQELRRTREILELIGLQRNPEECIEHFSHFEKQLVCIAKMIYKGAQILMIDGLENKYSMREILHMRSLVSVLSGMDLALIFLQRQPAEMLSICSKCVLMRRGSDVKVLFQPEITRERISEYRLSNTSSEAKPENPVQEKVRRISRKFSVKNQHGTEKRYRIIGYYDLGVDSKVHFREYLQHLNESQVQVSIDGELLRDIVDRDGESLIVGINSVEELMYNLNLGENLAFTFRYMEKRRRYLMRHKLCTYLRMEFLKKFDIDPKVRKLEELSYFERKLLSIYRWLQVGDTRSIILEEPYLNLQGDEIEQMQQYLTTICQEHAPVGIFSKNALELMKTCDVILLSYNQRFIKYYEKEDFDKIIPETTRMIDELA